MEISYNGKMYNIQKIHPQETDQQLIARSWWIMTYLESNPNFEEATLYSKYWHNVIYKQCKYSKAIMERIMNTKFC